ncbi:fimbrial protein [Citrobacter telavivensis]|uniref:fimbrial protein n=1 Tax=Citrobacter telavivensis TaxID=2653932 RepID=UPI00359D5B57
MTVTARIFSTLLMASALLVLPPAQAAPGSTGDKYSLDINMYGTLMANSSCTFNEGGPLQVDFGDVQLKEGDNNTVEVDGEYSKPMPSDFTCIGETGGLGLLQMKFTSTSGSYETWQGTAVMAVDKGIVGIEMQVNGTAQNMDEWFDVDPDAMPVLTAKLVQLSTTNSQNVVSGDKFNASGTLTLAFN